MTKNLQDYLGQNTTYQDGVLTINLEDLLAILSLSPWLMPSSSNAIGVVSLLLQGLFETTKPELTDSGFPIDDPSSGLVSNVRSARPIIVNRGDETQVRTRLEFNLYAENRNTYSPDKIIGSDPGGDELN